MEELFDAMQDAKQVQSAGSQACVTKTSLLLVLGLERVASDSAGRT